MTTSEVSRADVEATEALAPKGPAAVDADARKMFKFSTYLDFGPGAAECERSRDGQCQDIEHFHAWCRLPNPLQQENIRKTAAAAKARVLRSYGDPESDLAVVLDGELAALNDEAFRDSLVDELMSRDWADDYMAAQGNVDATDEWEHIDAEREEHARLNALEENLPEEERSPEYKDALERMSKYITELREELAKVQAPRRDELNSRSIPGLIELLRARRVEEYGDRAFVDTFNIWQWFVGTFKVEKHPALGRPHIRMWDELGRPESAVTGTMYGEAPEIIEQLRITYSELQSALQRGSSGN